MKNNNKNREPDIGAMARFEGVKADPAALGVILQRLGSGDSLRSICRAWGIPYHAACQWLIAEGRALVNARCGPALRPVHRQRSDEQQPSEGELI